MIRELRIVLIGAGSAKVEMEREASGGGAFGEPDHEVGGETVGFIGEENADGGGLAAAKEVGGTVRLESQAIGCPADRPECRGTDPGIGVRFGVQRAGDNGDGEVQFAGDVLQGRRGVGAASSEQSFVHAFSKHVRLPVCQALAGSLFQLLLSRPCWCPQETEVASLLALSLTANDR